MRVEMDILVSLFFFFSPVAHMTDRRGRKKEEKNERYTILTDGDATLLSEQRRKKCFEF